MGTRKMKTINDPKQSITWISPIIPYGITHGALPDALASQEVSDDQTLWNEVIEDMLSWLSDSSIFDPEDRPDKDILETALDSAYDQRSVSAPVPSNVVPSGSGRIAFEWYVGNDAEIVEFIGLGKAIYTKFEGDRVVETSYLFRNPQSRKLEKEG